MVSRFGDKKTPSAQKKGELPWIEKYRPKKLSDIADQAHVVDALSNTLKSGNLPHLLFYGPPGTGKTSTILAVARELYGPKLMKKRVLELNASDERGINVVRTKIKNFAKIAVGKQKVKGHPCPPYKIIILDEADSMTTDAQSALRRTMESYSTITRFCIICNYVSRIIDPITSRCAKFRYNPLSDKAMIGKLKQISESEFLQCEEGVLPHLVSLSEGDMRRSVMYLQTGQKLVAKGEKITMKQVNDMVGQIPREFAEKVLDACMSGSFTKIQKEAEACVACGFPADSVLFALSGALVDRKEVSSEHKAKICIKIAEVDKCVVEGASEYFQILDVLSYACCVIKGQER